MSGQADDIEVLSRARDWLQAGHRVALATVIRTWGSSPRPPGSLLAMNEAGYFVGSVSGGCVEETLVARYRDGELAGPAPTLLDFGVERQEATRMGLPCGGRLELLVEELDNAASIETLLGRLQNGELVVRRVDLGNGEVTLFESEGTIEFQVSETGMIKTFGPAWQLLIIGDGQLARHLATMAQQLDYQVIICDPREEYDAPALLAGVHYSREMPDDAVQGLGDQTRTAIVALAHDPRLDDLGLSTALNSRAFYIGVLGSKRSAQARVERLRSLGFSAEQIERIHGPAGLHIGSKRPAEIAVSILAEITTIRNGIPERAKRIENA
jgi:xanthine dehydrogenase accessory factor